MNYKCQYVPFELLIDGQWRRLNRQLSNQEIQKLGESFMTIFPTEWNTVIK